MLQIAGWHYSTRICGRIQKGDPNGVALLSSLLYGFPGRITPEGGRQ